MVRKWIVRQEGRKPKKKGEEENTRDENKEKEKARGRKGENFKR